MMPTLSVMAPAKLNLFLHITGQREDGYHTLQTLFQLLDWGDTLTFDRNDSGKVTLESPDLGFEQADNLIMAAARQIHQPGLGAHIVLDKQIPIGGGLGGGSSNAATTLMALNLLWDLNIEPLTLLDIGASLGADVPVFLAGHTAWAEGIGEALTPVELDSKWYVVIFPQTPVNTGEIFSKRQLTRDTPAITIATFFEGHSRNDCQPVVIDLYPEIGKALAWLGSFAESRLTGTGACVFASFASQAEADAVRCQVPTYWNVMVARGVNESPALKQLVLTR
jgi:4-diphosphocytidyl-2-C-methyl-D-erythritol kinase